MKASAIHDDFKGYGGYPIAKGERIIRDRIIECMRHIHEKNEHCLARAREGGREKLLSEIESLKKRIEAIQGYMENAGRGARYTFEKLPADREARLKELDAGLWDLLSQCAGMLDRLSCSDTDVHAIEHYTRMNAHLHEIDRAFRERMKIIRLMYVFG